MDISRAEQEPFTAQQEHGDTDTTNLPSHDCTLHCPFTNDHREVLQLATVTTTDTTRVNDNAQHVSQSVDYHGDDNVSDDYMELLGGHRSSPIFI